MESPSIKQTLVDSQSGQMQGIRGCNAPREAEAAASRRNPSTSRDVSPCNSTESDCTGQETNTCCDSHNSYSVSDCGTPQEAELVSLSNSPTPIGNDPGPLDPAQIMLRPFLQAARLGVNGLPQWDGLGESLRLYFAEGWRRDSYTKEETEKRKEFLSGMRYLRRNGESLKGDIRCTPIYPLCMAE